jgi:regulation of enolase protein 1 (concanavalin A-like superfamily)
MDKMMQLSYTAYMRKITMRDFRWMGKPRSWDKDHRTVSLSVEPQMHLPDGPLLLAVSDDDFSCNMTLSSSGNHVFAGVCFYHLDTDYIGIGISTESLEIHVMINGFLNYSRIPLKEGSNQAIWSMKRRGSHLSIGYRRQSSDSVTWVGSYTLPGIQKSVSFGPYFANEGSEDAKASMSALDYKKEI